MKVKLIALDLDGTTLTRNGLTRRTKETLEECIRRKIHVVVATGRVFSALPQKVLEIEGLEYVITSNGACITELKTGKEIYRNCIKKEEISTIINLLKPAGHPIEIFTDGRAYIDSRVYDDLEKNGSSYMSAKYILRTRKPVDDIYSFLESHEDRIENINIHFEFFEEKTLMKEVLEKIENVTITSSVPHNLEIGGADTSKATALYELCAELGIEMSDVMAFGDSPNDGAMLSESGTAVAMGNATDDIKEVADIIAPTNDEEGVAYIIRKELLGDNFAKRSFCEWIRALINS